MSTSGAGRSAPGGRLLGGAHVAPQGGSCGSRRSHRAPAHGTAVPGVAFDGRHTVESLCDRPFRFVSVL